MAILVGTPSGTTQSLRSYTLSSELVQAGVFCFLNGSTPVPVTAIDRLPVDTGTVTVTGTVAVSSAPTTAITAASLPLPSGAATESTLSTISGRLPSALSGGGRLTVDATGTVAVSSSALPAGAATETSVAAAATSLTVIDDWDESDRCKVNPIAGQAGVAGGSGTVGATTQRVCLATDVALPAGTNTLGGVFAIPEGGSLAVSGTSLTPKRAAIAASSSGNNTLVAAVASKKIRVLALWLIANGSVNAKLQDGAGGTDMTGLAYLAVNCGLVLPFNPLGWAEGSTNTLLNLNLSGAVAVGGSLIYVEV